MRRHAVIACAAFLVVVAAGCAAGSDSTAAPEAGSGSIVSTSTLVEVEQEEPEDEEEDDEDVSRPTPTLDLTTTGIVEEVPCPDNASCAAEFAVNGRVYSLSCRPIDPAEVDLTNELGRGWAFGRDVRAHALLRVPTLDVVALSIPEELSGCLENPGPDAPRSAWQFAFTRGADVSIVCTVGLHTPAEAANDGCDQEQP